MNCNEVERSLVMHNTYKLIIADNMQYLVGSVFIVAYFCHEIAR